MFAIVAMTTACGHEPTGNELSAHTRLVDLGDCLTAYYSSEHVYPDSLGQLGALVSSGKVGCPFDDKLFLQGSGTSVAFGYSFTYRRVRPNAYSVVAQPAPTARPCSFQMDEEIVIIETCERQWWQLKSTVRRFRAFDRLADGPQ
jgi:hypothetical protein